MSIQCVPLLLFGVRAMFTPAGMAETFGVATQSINGLSTIRGDLGGLLLGTALMIGMGLWRNNTTWFLAAALLMSIVAFGRIVGFAVDGVDTATIRPFVAELLIVGVMLFAHWRLSTEK